MRSASSSTCSRRTTCSPNGSPGSCTTSPSMPSPGKAGVSEPRQAADFLREARERRSEEHTPELQSQSNLGCRHLLQKKKQSLRHSLGAPPPHISHGPLAP